MADLDDLIDALDSLTSEKTRKRIQRKALRAVADVVQPALTAATPERLDKPVAGTSLQPGDLKRAIRNRTRVTQTEASLTVDFGQLHLVAAAVDGGHVNPDAKHPGKLEMTPPHPFIRAVEEQTAAAAVAAYTESLDQAISKELRKRGK